MVNINKYGEIEDTTCSGCGNPIKMEWVACPHCGKALSNNCPKCQKPLKPEWKACPYCANMIYRGASRKSSPKLKSSDRSTQIMSHRPYPSVSVKELESWAHSSEGLDMSSSNATRWAKTNVQFFKENSFSIFYELFNWALSGKGIYTKKDKAESWARSNVSFFQNHDFGHFKIFFAWAIEKDGLAASRPMAADWAKEAVLEKEKGASVREIKTKAKYNR